jgi:hypothetical protein
MKRASVLGFLFLLFMMLPGHLHAQSRWLLGVEGGDTYDNYNFGVTGSAEIPFAKHFELDLKDTFSPIESHVALGQGRANITRAGGFIWLTKSWGLNGWAEDSMYDVTKVTKDADYASGGLTYRSLVGGMPARFSFNYIQQFNNGVTNGLETSHLQGFDFGYTTRFGCVGIACVRMSADLQFGKVLTQGNPVCDGSFGGAITCPRGAAFGGGAQASVALEFPRHRGHEYEVF